MFPDAFSTYFDGIAPVTQEEFLEKYDGHIRQRESLGAPDAYEKHVLEKLRAKSRVATIAYFRGELSARGFENLILPHHDGPPSVPIGGQPFHDVIRNFRKVIDSNQSSAVVAKINALDWSKIRESEPQSFLWVCNSKEDAHPGHYSDSHGHNRIYMGNGFHRFVAYGLWRLENKPPLMVHFVDI